MCYYGRGLWQPRSGALWSANESLVYQSYDWRIFATSAFRRPLRHEMHFAAIARVERVPFSVRQQNMYYHPGPAHDVYMRDGAIHKLMRYDQHATFEALLADQHVPLVERGQQS